MTKKTRIKQPPVRDIPAGTQVICKQKFSCVYADPPWQINQTGKRGASMHYRVMPLDWIKNFPVKDLTTDDAVLFLWTVDSGLPAALDVMEAWGFKYMKSFIWHKDRAGWGVYNHSCHEQLLLGVKVPSVPAIHNQPSCNFFPVQDHSHKPEEYYAIIERMYPGRDYLELFARKRTTHKGWYIFGDEAEGGSDIYIPGYPVPEYSDKVTFIPPLNPAPAAAMKVPEEEPDSSSAPAPFELVADPELKEAA